MTYTQRRHGKRRARQQRRRNFAIHAAAQYRCHIAVTQCPLTWWREHGDDYARIREVARRYLAAPSTSVASERLFSGAGQLYSDSRSRLAPDKAEMLLFIKFFITHFQK